MQKNSPFTKHNAYKWYQLSKQLRSDALHYGWISEVDPVSFASPSACQKVFLVTLENTVTWRRKMPTLLGGDFMSIPSWSSLWMGTSGASSSSTRGPQIFGSCGRGRKCLHWNSNSYSRPPEFPSKGEASSCKQEQGGGRGVRWRPWRMATARLVLTSSQKPSAPPQRLRW